VSATRGCGRSCSRIAARIRANPAVQVSPLWFIRLAAWQPLVAPPGTTYHHSNIGWNIAGLIAAKASGKPLPLLYRERIFQPLRLRHAAYDRQGPIAGAYAKGYALAAKGTVTDTTAWHLGKGARRRDRHRRQGRGKRW
jgi:D-alanyl-D-alanine carboxypeptidase